MKISRFLELQDNLNLYQDQIAEEGFSAACKKVSDSLGRVISALTDTKLSHARDKAEKTLRLLSNLKVPEEALAANIIFKQLIFNDLRKCLRSKEYKLDPIKIASTGNVETQAEKYMQLASQSRKLQFIVRNLFYSLYCYRQISKGETSEDVKRVATLIKTLKQEALKPLFKGFSTYNVDFTILHPLFSEIIEDYSRTANEACIMKWVKEVKIIGALDMPVEVHERIISYVPCLSAVLLTFKLWHHLAKGELARRYPARNTKAYAEALFANNCLNGILAIVRKENIDESVFSLDMFGAALKQRNFLLMFNSCKDLFFAKPEPSKSPLQAELYRKTTEYADLLKHEIADVYQSFVLNLKVNLENFEECNKACKRNIIYFLSNSLIEEGCKQKDHKNVIVVIQFIQKYYIQVLIGDSLEVWKTWIDNLLNTGCAFDLIKQVLKPRTYRVFMYRHIGNYYLNDFLKNNNKLDEILPLLFTAKELEKRKSKADKYRSTALELMSKSITPDTDLNCLKVLSYEEIGLLINELMTEQRYADAWRVNLFLEMDLKSYYEGYTKLIEANITKKE